MLSMLFCSTIMQLYVFRFVLDFLRGPESLEYFNKFPSKPPQVFHMYLKQNNIPYVIKDVPVRYRFIMKVVKFIV